MKAAAQFYRKVSYHRDFNWQGLQDSSLENYGGKLEDEEKRVWRFPDGSKGRWVFMGEWPDGTEKRFFAALTDVEGFQV